MHQYLSDVQQKFFGRSFFGQTATGSVGFFLGVRAVVSSKAKQNSLIILHIYLFIYIYLIFITQQALSDISIVISTSYLFVKFMVLITVVAVQFFHFTIYY